MAPTSTTEGIRILYDGDCPACSAYVRLVRLREVAGKVNLVNLREAPEEVARLKAKGLDVNEGFVVEVGEKQFHGPDAVHAMTMLSSPSGLVNRINYAIFKSPVAARMLYPALKAGRNALLAVLGRSKIAS